MATVKMDLDRAAMLFAVEHLPPLEPGRRGEENLGQDAIELYANCKDLLERAWRDGHRWGIMEAVGQIEVPTIEDETEDGNHVRST